jgi:hypothetical protein
MVKYLLLALALLLAAPTPAAAQGVIPCNQWSIIHAVGPVAATQLIPAPTNQRVGLCGYAMVASVLAATLQLSYGSGINCATAPANISPPITLAVGGVLVSRTDYIMERAPANNAVCFVATSGATGVMDAIVYWTYF